MAHGDYTGNAKAALARQFNEDQRAAATRMSLVTQVATESRDEVVDLTTDADRELQLLRQEQLEDDGVTEVDVNNDDLQMVRFRASETLDNITVGKDRTLSLEEGQTYTAPHWVVAHLDEKQLVRH